jgi:protein-tyrosine phosphatase
MNILMVCLGNICRSPLAEGILQHKINQLGLDWRVDSAGTGGWHAGEPPDARSVAVAHRYGIDISQQRARQLQVLDFERFDHILVMDSDNYNNTRHLARNDAERAKVELVTNYATPGLNRAVPDPYYGGPEGFEQVFALLDQSIDGFIERMRDL